jgi:hypothetical protein
MRLTKWKSWSSLPRKLSRLDHPCTNLSVSSAFVKRALTLKTFHRGDYKKLCEMLVSTWEMFQVLTVLSLAPAMKQGIVTAVQTNVFNVADKRFTG